MTASGEEQASTLERRCRLLLRAYPAAYRDERGEEIIGTLLEATPDGRAWPLPRDVRGLLIGGLRARAAVNQRGTTSANLRVAVVVGLAAYLAYISASIVSLQFSAIEHIGLWFGGRPWSLRSDWPVLLVCASNAVTLGLVWVTSRRAFVLAAAVPAAAIFALAGSWQSGSFGFLVTELASLVTLIALVGGRRPGRWWLWPIGIVVLARLLEGARLLGNGSALFTDAAVSLALALGVLSILWLLIDARPAIAMVVFLLAGWLPSAVNNLSTGAGIAAGIPLLFICIAVSAVAVWRLHRQSGKPGQPTSS